MKKIVVLLLVFLLVGCSTPEEKALKNSEKFLKLYYTAESYDFDICEYDSGVECIDEISENFATTWDKYISPEYVINYDESFLPTMHHMLQEEVEFTCEVFDVRVMSEYEGIFTIRYDIDLIYPDNMMFIGGLLRFDENGKIAFHQLREVEQYEG